MITADELLPQLSPHLPAYLACQRWSGAHDREISSVNPLWHEVVSTDQAFLVWTVVRASFADGDEQDFQLFLAACPARPLPDFLHGKEREIVAVLPDGDASTVVYDALVDPDLAIEVLHLTAPDMPVTVRRPIVLEHSNSSIVFDEAHILKLFRKIEPGPNPDVEISRVLAERGYEHVLPPLAELRRDGVDLAVLREFLVGATEGWEIARASVRDLLAGEAEPEESGADFAPDADRLGRLLGELHLTMADAWGAHPGDAVQWGAEMDANLKDVLANSSEAHDALDVDAIAARFAALQAITDAGQEIRIHGDLHLAQVIKSDAGWKVLDFEGEPARRRADRFTTSSPLRDVAGLLRSLHYAAMTGLLEWSADDPALSRLVDRWERRNRGSLVGGYLSTDGIGALLPSSEVDRDTVLQAFELDKAVYEVGYELGYRPDLVAIPLAGVARVLEAQAEG